MGEERDFILEDSLGEEPGVSGPIVEVPLDDRALVYLGFFVLGLTFVMGVRIAFLNFFNGNFYAARAQANLFDRNPVAAPRGVITDRNGIVLAESRPAFALYFDIKRFLEEPEFQGDALLTLTRVLGVSLDDLTLTISESVSEGESAAPVLLAPALAQSQLVAVRDTKNPVLIVREGFERVYPKGNAFSSVLGYLSKPSREDLQRFKGETIPDLVGKSGIESFYDADLQGVPGEYVRLRDAKGEILGESRVKDPEIGRPLKLTIDAELQEYFSKRFEEGLALIGRKSGVGIALNPETGEVLALLNFPSFDGNVFNIPGNNSIKRELLTSSDRPLFNRAISGLYSPGSTIKPLVGLAALAEGVVVPEKTVFSPGYLDVPNPYDPANPTRFLDWRYQGEVNLASAIAQSSNVYFYAVGGGAFDIGGLGIDRLHKWWRKFLLDQPTGIDLPGEQKGFLPTIEWKEKNGNEPWRLGDTYNVSIGQGDLLVTPVRLLTYVAAIANGGSMNQPFINKGKSFLETLDIDGVSEENLAEVQRGMLEAVRSPLGTAHILSDLPFKIAGKTGSAQIQNNKQENAFFVGYAPASSPKIAVLVLVENALQGSLNAVPIAKDVLAWYYEHRIKR